MEDGHECHENHDSLVVAMWRNAARMTESACVSYLCALINKNDGRATAAAEKRAIHHLSSACAPKKH